jgi:hypothetical protein
MEAHTAAHPTTTTPPRGRGVSGLGRRFTETKQALKTTEFWAMLGVIAAILIAGAVDDGFGARQVWLYVSIVASAYMISRGLAKSGSSEPRMEDQQQQQQQLDR